MGDGQASHPASHRLTEIGTIAQLAIAHARQGQFEAAASLLQHALESKPEAAELHNNLGMVLYEQRQMERATLCYQKAIAIRSNYALAHNNLGVALAAQGRHSEAVTCYEAALAIQADYPEALNNLGASLHALARSKDAVQRFRRALALRPNFFDARMNLAHALAALEKYTEAISCYRTALQIEPNNTVGLLNLATALRELNRHDEAGEYCRRAIAIDPATADAHAALGDVLLETGAIGEAKKCFERAISLVPHRPRYYLGLSKTTKINSKHSLFTSIRGLGETLEEVGGSDKVDTHYLLGKVLADNGETEKSFEHLLAGSALKRRTISYNESEVLGQIDRTRTVFSAEFMRQRRVLGCQSTTPVFIVGMPRSGSTLVEQVLASHPLIYAAGEVDNFCESLQAQGLHVKGQPFPDSVLDWTDDKFRAAASEYIRRLEREARRYSKLPSVKRVTDKMLSNFRYIGLIHMMLPNARIIHTRRNPIDTCMSCFSINFAKLRYTFDLGELGRYYRSYRQLMEHWRAVLPPNRILEVQYEDFVGDFEQQARQLIAYCGLDWEDRCLDFYETRRPVRTASLTQVRQPIYKNAVGRWRAYEPYLGPLLTAIAE